MDNDLKVISAQMKSDQNNIVDLNADINDLKNKSKKNLVKVEKTLSDVKDEILNKFMEINSTTLKKFSKMDHVVKIFGEELKIDKDQVRSEILSLNKSFTNEIFLLNKSLTNEVNLNRNISKKTEEAMANLEAYLGKCKDGWSKYGVGSFNILFFILFILIFNIFFGFLRTLESRGEGG